MHVFKIINTYQALFASCIPEIIDLIGTRPKYGGAYKNERGRRLAADIYLYHGTFCLRCSLIFISLFSTLIVFNKTGIEDE